MGFTGRNSLRRFFVGISYTQSKNGQRIMCFANIFNIYIKWKFYSGNITSDFEKLTFHFAQLIKGTLSKLKNRLSPTHKIVFQYSTKLSHDDRNSILEAARTVILNSTYVFVWINSHHNVRFYDNRPEIDGSLRHGSYVKAGRNKIYLSTTGSNSFCRVLGTLESLRISAWIQKPKGLPDIDLDLRVLAV